MTFRLIVFDIDGTLIPFGKMMTRNVSATIRYFENLGVRIALSSGKNISYLEGMAQDIGIKKPLIIAENGCVIVDMAESKEVWLTKRTPEIQKIREKILGKFSDFIEEQPNNVELTFSITALKPEAVSYVKGLINEYRDRVHAYEYAGCLDILPVGVDKGVGLAEAKRMYGFEKEAVVAIGDGQNDIPMFKEAGLALIVGKQISYPNAISFDTIEEVLDFLTKCL
ncbi:MAG: HAD-IIB family hydrolase [Candidatus Bathyarchaeota archaeon]